jgi:hypothetical protein
MTRADYSVAAFALLNGGRTTAFKRIDVAHRATMLWHRIASLRHAQNLLSRDVFTEAGSRCWDRDFTPSARHRDDMIRQGLMS